MKSDGMKSSQSIRETLGLPWNSNGAMLACIEDDERRKLLIEYIASKGFQGVQSAASFLARVYSKKMRYHITTNE